MPYSGDNRLKVGIVLEEGRYGGPQAETLLLGWALRNHGVDAHVIYSKHNSEKLSRKLSEKGVSGLAVNITRLSREGKVLIRYFSCFLAEIIMLYRLFKRERFDIIHVNGSYQIKGALAAKIAGIPVVWHLNDTYTLRPVKKMFAAVARICARGFIVNGWRVHDYYIRGTVLENRPHIKSRAPLDAASFDPERVGMDKRLEEYGGIKVLTVSNVNPVKGLEYFIETASILSGKYEGLHFFVAGNIYSSQARYYEKLKELARVRGLGNLVFMGGVDDVASALNAVDIFAFTSLSESGPIAVWEAMSMAKAIVSTDVGEVSVLIKDGENGFVVPTGDAVAMAERVGLLVEDEELRKEMGRRARETVLKHLDADTCARRHAEFYRVLAG